MAKPTPLRRIIYSIFIGLLGFGLLAFGLFNNPLSTEAWLYIGVLSLLGVVLSAVGANVTGGAYLGLEPTAYYAAMISLNPWAAGLVAVWPNVRWVVANRLPIWGLLRNGGMYALMGIGGGSVYQFIAGGSSLPADFLIHAAALLAAILVVRLINDLLILVDNIILLSLSYAVSDFLATWRATWGLEALAALPALLTALIYSQANLRLSALPIWLALLVAGAVGLYGLVRARNEVRGRLDELSTANERMSLQGRREAALAVQLGQAADELAGYASRLSAALFQQHTAVTEVTSTVEELAQQARHIAEAASAVDSTAEEALTTAGQGQDAAAGSVQAMADLEYNVREMNNRMNALEARSRLIRRTLVTINNIANETHLLALNATIEAAGAGEQGRRFAVVAGQINALADQALRAATEIGATVREIEAATADTRGAIEQGLRETRRYTEQVDQARQAIESILGAVGRASDMAQQIRLATQQQTQASRQVTDAMREIALSTGTASSEGSAVYTAAENLQRIARELRSLDISHSESL